MKRLSRSIVLAERVRMLPKARLERASGNSLPLRAGQDGSRQRRCGPLRIGQTASDPDSYELAVAEGRRATSQIPMTRATIDAIAASR